MLSGFLDFASFLYGIICLYHLLICLGTSAVCNLSIDSITRHPRLLSHQTSACSMFSHFSIFTQCGRRAFLPLSLICRVCGNVKVLNWLSVSRPSCDRWSRNSRVERVEIFLEPATVCKEEGKNSVYCLLFRYCCNITQFWKIVCAVYSCEGQQLYHFVLVLFFLFNHKMM